MVFVADLRAGRKLAYPAMKEKLFFFSDVGESGA